MAAGTPLLASDGDINGLLASVGNFTISSADPATANYNDMQADAARLIKSQLSGVFQVATLVSWVDPDTTPATIRAIAARLIAATYYSKQIADDQTAKIPAWAQWLYDTALGMLNQIKAGTLQVVGDDGTPIADQPTTAESAADFWPNDTTEGPYFVMDKKWG